MVVYKSAKTMKEGGEVRGRGDVQAPELNLTVERSERLWKARGGVVYCVYIFLFVKKKKKT